jgi:hypothetical protein
MKEAADVFGVPLITYAKWEYCKRTPHELTLFEIRRRMAATKTSS